MLAGGHGNEKPNANYMNGRGFWSFYILCITLFHLIMLSIPIDAFSVKLVWTVTNLSHNAISFWFLHWIKSTPWLSCDQGSVRRLTHWEQIDHGLQYTPTRKFLTIIPILLFFLTSFYTHYDKTHFVLNTVSLGFVLVPKHPTFHKKIPMDNCENNNEMLNNVPTVKENGVKKRQRRILIHSNSAANSKRNDLGELVYEIIHAFEEHALSTVGKNSGHKERTPLIECALSNITPTKTNKGGYRNMPFSKTSDIRSANLTTNQNRTVNRMTVSEGRSNQRKTIKKVDTGENVSSQTDLFQTPVRKGRRLKRTLVETAQHQLKRTKIIETPKLRQPLITIPTLADIAGVDEVEFSLPRDYRALKLEIQRENIVQSQMDTEIFKIDSQTKGKNSTLACDEELLPDSPSLISSKRKPRIKRQRANSNGNSIVHYEQSICDSSGMISPLPHDNTPYNNWSLGKDPPENCNDTVNDRNSKIIMLHDHLSVSQPNTPYKNSPGQLSSNPVCLIEETCDEKDFSAFNEKPPSCGNTMILDSLVCDTEDIFDTNSTRINRRLKGTRTIIDEKVPPTSKNNDHCIVAQYSTSNVSNSPTNNREENRDRAILTNLSEDIFDIDDEVFKERVNLQSAEENAPSSWSDNDVCLQALQDVCGDSASNRNAKVFQPNAQLKNGPTYENNNISDINSTLQSPCSTSQHRVSNKISDESTCIVEKWFFNHEYVKNGVKRILCTLVGKERYVVAAILNTEAYIYLQNKDTWKLLRKFKRFEGDTMNSHTSNTFVLLSTHSNTLDCYVCLKSFAVSKEGEMQFLKEYSYYSYFNLESIDDIESSSSEDEIYGERGGIALVKCVKLEERSCILSYHLPSCNRTRQSMLLYNEESSHCDQYKLPSIYGDVTSYQCFYNVNSLFATTTSQDGEKVCHLWNVKLVTTAKKPKGHIDAQKCLLSSKLLISLDCMNDSNRPATLLAYENGLIAFQSVNGHLYQSIEEINLNKDNNKNDPEYVHEKLISLNLDQITESNMLWCMYPFSFTYIIIEATNALYRLNIHD